MEVKNAGSLSGSSGAKWKRDGHFVQISLGAGREQQVGVLLPAFAASRGVRVCGCC